MMVVVTFSVVYKIEKDELQVNKTLRAKYLWRLHIGMLKPTLSIRAFGDPLVRARKAGRLMNQIIVFSLQSNAVNISNSLIVFGLNVFNNSLE